MLVLARLAVSLKKAGHVQEAQQILQRLGGRHGPKELVQEVNQAVDEVANERKALSQEINQKKVAASLLESQVSALDQQIEAAETQLRGLKPRITEMEGQAKSGIAVDEPEYHRLIAQYNEIVEKHNADVNSRKQLYAQYGATVQDVNRLVDQYNRLATPKVGTP